MTIRETIIEVGPTLVAIGACVAGFVWLCSAILNGMAAI